MASSTIVYFVTVVTLLNAVASVSKSPVTKLSENNFEKKVLQSTDVWMVEFMAPW